MDTPRFKIDVYEHSFRNPFALYFRHRRWFWKMVRSFETKELAREHYEKIKDLPEYLA